MKKIKKNKKNKKNIIIKEEKNIQNEEILEKEVTSENIETEVDTDSLDYYEKKDDKKEKENDESDEVEEDLKLAKDEKVDREDAEEEIKEEGALEEDDKIEESEEIDAEFLEVENKDGASKEETLEEKKEEKLTEEQLDKEIKDIITMNKKIRKTIIQGILYILILTALLTGFAIYNRYNNKIIHNVYVNDFNLSGKTKEEALSFLKEKYESASETETILKYQDYEESLTPASIEFVLDYEAMTEEAYNLGRKNNILISNFEIIKNYIFKYEVPVVEKYNKENLDQKILTISGKIPGLVKEPTHSVEGKQLHIYSGVSGVTVDQIKLKKLIISKFSKLEEKSTITIPVNETEPSKINIDKILEEVKKPVVDASYDPATEKLTIESDGIDVEMDKASITEMLLEKKEEYIIPLKIIKPTVTVEKLQNTIFKEVVSAYQTNYNASLTERTRNIQLATKKVNSYVLYPGQEFSFNKVVGKRTIDAGYKNAATYAGGKVVSDIGGGICQLSTTIYNAALLGDFEITERHNHAMPVSYERVGKDATVYYGALDFKFRNNKNYPVKIVATATGGVNRVEIKGFYESDVKVKITTQKVRTIARNVVVKKDPSLAPGERKVVDEGKDGQEVITYKERIVNGVSQGRKQISRDVLKAYDKIINEG